MSTHRTGIAFEINIDRVLFAHLAKDLIGVVTIETPTIQFDPSNNDCSWTYDPHKNRITIYHNVHIRGALYELASEQRIASAQECVQKTGELIMRSLTRGIASWVVRCHYGVYWDMDVALLRWILSGVLWIVWFGVAAAITTLAATLGILAPIAATLSALIICFLHTRYHVQVDKRVAEYTSSGSCLAATLKEVIKKMDGDERWDNVLTILASIPADD